MAFAVFCFDVRWPDGGWSDWIATAATQREAQSIADRAYAGLVGDCVQVVNLDTGEVVFTQQNVTRDKRPTRTVPA